MPENKSILNVKQRKLKIISTFIVAACIKTSQWHKNREMYFKWHTRIILIIVNLIRLLLLFLDIFIKQEKRSKKKMKKKQTHTEMCSFEFSFTIFPLRPLIVTIL